MLVCELVVRLVLEYRSGSLAIAVDPHDLMLAQDEIIVVLLCSCGSIARVELVVGHYLQPSSQSGLSFIRSTKLLVFCYLFDKFHPFLYLIN